MLYKENDYGKDYMKIKFNSDDDLPLNKPLKFRAMTITIGSGFEEDGASPLFILFPCRTLLFEKFSLKKALAKF